MNLSEEALALIPDREWRINERGDGSIDYSVLDHGYLRVKDTWGSDEEIVETARMSTSKGFLGWEPGECPSCKGTGRRQDLNDFSLCDDCGGKGKIPGDAKLLKYLYENKHCYDEKTEVLTQAGFKRWSEVADDDLLACWDPHQETLVYELPKGLIRARHSGDMYRVDHGGVDLLVTTNHQMYVKRIERLENGKQGWGADWQLVEAEDLGDHSMIRYRKHAPMKDALAADLSSFPAANDQLALLRLFGFFIGDGHAARPNDTVKNYVVFHLKKRRKVLFLRELALELGWELRTLANDTYALRTEGIAPIFRGAFYNASTKSVPSVLLGLNREEAQAVLEGLKASDGSQKRGAWEFFTSSVQVADSFERIVIHAGECCHRGGDGYMHRLMVLSRMREPVVNQGKKNTSLEHYDGYVYCAHTRTGILVVRRNGKVVLSGNSTPFEFAGLTIEVQAPLFVFREWHRHRVPFGYSEMSARYVKMPNLHYVPSVERIISSSRKSRNRQAGGAGSLIVPVEGTGKHMATEEEMAREIQERIRNEQERIYTFYETMLGFGVAKEVARLDTPVSRYSRMRATGNLRGWLGFLTLRMDPHAQFEIRQFAWCVADAIATAFPRTYELFFEGMTPVLEPEMAPRKLMADALKAFSWTEQDFIKPEHAQAWGVKISSIHDRLRRALGRVA